jgi:hypothetical protein
MAGALAAALLAGCNGEDARTDCSLDACTITFDRGADGSAEVLGVTVELVSATEEEVTVAAGGQDVTVPVGETREVAGLTIEVDRVTQDEVVVRATR